MLGRVLSDSPNKKNLHLPGQIDEVSNTLPKTQKKNSTTFMVPEGKNLCHWWRVSGRRVRQMIMQARTRTQAVLQCRHQPHCHKWSNPATAEASGRSAALPVLLVITIITPSQLHHSQLQAEQWGHAV